LKAETSGISISLKLNGKTPVEVAFIRPWRKDWKRTVPMIPAALKVIIEAGFGWILTIRSAVPMFLLKLATPQMGGAPSGAEPVFGGMIKQRAGACIRLPHEDCCSGL
jgi:hypothetical protein